MRVYFVKFSEEKGYWYLDEPAIIRPIPSINAVDQDSLIGRLYPYRVIKSVLREPW